jgi:mannose-6-phosphate isomerase
MPRHPISTGDTVYVPGGTLHSFGPGTLIFEIQQTSDLVQQVMPTDIYGNRLSNEQWDANIEATLAELRTTYLPKPNTGITITRDDNRYTVCCAGPHFALERWSLAGSHQQSAHQERCLTMTNVGDPVVISFDGREERLERAESCVIPAVLGDYMITPEGEGDLIVCYEPNLEAHIIGPLREAGFADEQISSLGEVFPSS